MAKRFLPNLTKSVKNTGGIKITRKIDLNSASKTTNALVGLPFENIIGSPLDAAIKAQAMSANTTIAFIKEVGFRQNTSDKLEPLGGNTDSGFGDIRYVNFKLMKRKI